MEKRDGYSDQAIPNSNPHVRADQNTIDREHFFLIAKKRCPKNAFPEKTLSIYSKTAFCMPQFG